MEQPNVVDSGLTFVRELVIPRSFSRRDTFRADPTMEERIVSFLDGQERIVILHRYNRCQIAVLFDAPFARGELTLHEDGINAHIERKRQGNVLSVDDVQEEIRTMFWRLGSLHSDIPLYEQGYGAGGEVSINVRLPEGIKHMLLISKLD